MTTSQRGKAELNELLEAINLEWLITNEGLDYRTSYGRSGLQLQLRRCPFCGTEEWKVYVNAETGLGNCFTGSCPKGTFNKWSFLRQVFEVSNADLARKLKELVIQQGYKPKVKAPERLDLGTLVLPASTPVADMDPMPTYLVDRGVTREVAERFHLRYCDSGIFTINTPIGMRRQDYSNRIILPIFDIDGTLRSFQGRDVTGNAEQRYLFPPMYASAGSLLYNANRVGERTETLVICEGPFDVLAAHAAIRSDSSLAHMEAVGTFGMHLSIGHPDGDDQGGRLLQLRKRGVKRLIFLWDGEQKAALAAIEQMQRLLGLGFECMIALLPPGRDPGDAGRAAILAAIRSALPLRSKLGSLQLSATVRRCYP